MSLLQVLKILWQQWCLELPRMRAHHGSVWNVTISQNLKPMWESTWNPNMSSPLVWFAPFVSKCVPTKKVYVIIFIAITNQMNNKTILNSSSWRTIHVVLAGIDDLVASMMHKIVTDEGTSWSCRHCDYQSKKSTNVREHVESKHVQSSGVMCSICFKVCPNKKSLRNHCYSSHKSFE